ncbi:hypothetical protein [Bremerella sp.]|uniref:hypothetical protein n=1 Tax=Bremerella sp. TaxID=2795602 RepID=UPI00391C3A65
MSRHSISIGFDIVLPVVFGTLFVLHVILMLGVSSVWFALLYIRSNSRRDKNLTLLPLPGTLVAVGLFTTIVLAAHWYQPTKWEQQLMERRVALPTNEILLADLSFYFSRRNEDRPVLSSFTFRQEDRDKIIHLPSKNPTVRETLEAIQRDAGIEGRFLHCGNGYSVLFGPDCCFGLNVSASGIRGEPFDVIEYADQKLADLNAPQAPAP